MQEPRVVNLIQLNETTETTHLNGYWVPARSLTQERFMLWTRLKIAWGVFTGRYDALDWTGVRGPSRYITNDDRLPTITIKSRLS